MTNGYIAIVTLPAATAVGAAGTWKAAIELNGTEILNRPFTVTTGTGQPEIRVFLEDTDKTNIISGRTTPVDFGAVDVGAKNPEVI